MKTEAVSIMSKLKHMDALECFCFVAAVCCLLLVLQWGGQPRLWNSSTILGPLVGFCLLYMLCLWLHPVEAWRKGKNTTPYPLAALNLDWVWSSFLFGRINLCGNWVLILLV